MSVDTIGAAQLAPYDDEEEIQLMDMDGNNLQLDEPLIDTDTNVIQKVTTEEKPMKSVEKPSMMLTIQKLKVYIRDGPNRHHVDNILFDDKYYELPTTEELASNGISEENFHEILQSLNLTKEDFRTSASPTGSSRPESLFIQGVHNMSTQTILNCFEEFEPIGIEWISDQTCNVFWYDSITPIKLLSTKTNATPSISQQDSDNSTRSLKRKSSSMSRNDEANSSNAILRSGHWREGMFQPIDKPESEIKLRLRYTTLEDRKARGAENKSEYYRQHGNPNYNNMTGLISRSKKRALNAMRTDRFRDFTVVKPNDPTSTSNSVIEDTTATEDHPSDSNVKFTVVLPPKKHEEDDEDVEGGHRSKRQRRRRSFDDDDDDRQEKDTTHFTVTMDSSSKQTKNSSNKSTKDGDDDDGDSTSVLDARQILERKRRNRK